MQNDIHKFEDKQTLRAIEEWTGHRRPRTSIGAKIIASIVILILSYIIYAACT